MELTPDSAIGILVIFGVVIAAIVLMLKKLGIISIGNKNPYSNFHNSFMEVRDENLRHCQIIKGHEKRLEEGKVMFTSIKKDIAQMNINIVLIMRELNITAVSE